MLKLLSALAGHWPWGLLHLLPHCYVKYSGSVKEKPVGPQVASTFLVFIFGLPIIGS